MKILVLFFGLVISVQLSAEDIWENIGIAGLNVNYLTIDSQGNIYAAVKGEFYWGLWYHNIEGDAWKRLRVDTNFTKINSITFNGDGFFISSNNGLFSCKGTGDTLACVEYGPGNIFNSLINGTGDILVGGNGRLYVYILKTTNNGYSWKEKFFNTDEHNYWECFSVAGYQNNKVISCGCIHSFLDKQYHLIINISEDFGDSWLQLAKLSYSDESELYFEDFHVNQYNGDIYFPFKKKNEHYIWRAAKNKLEKISFPIDIDGLNNTLALSDGTLFLATSNSEDGVFMSTDSGTTWKELYTGLNHAAVNYLAADKNGILYAGTSNGVYRSRQPVVTEVNDKPAKVNDISVRHLAGSRSLDIEYSLGAAAEINIRVFNLLAENLVSVNRNTDTGDGSLHIDNIDLAPGIYFVTLESTHGIITKKFIVVN